MRKLVARRNYLDQIVIYKFFRRKCISKEKKETEIHTNKPAYSGLSILELSKVLMYEIWYDYVKPKYGGKIKLCYMDTDMVIWFTCFYT